MISDLTQADIESFFLAYDIFFDFLGIFSVALRSTGFKGANHLTVADLARPYYYFAVFYPAGSFDNGMIPLGYAAECGIKIIYFTCFFRILYLQLLALSLLLPKYVCFKYHRFQNQLGAGIAFDGLICLLGDVRRLLQMRSGP